MEKIAILTISTGNYKNFLTELTESVKSKFLTSKEKHIFVFTDQNFENNNDIDYIQISHLPWPLNTLLRFHYFKKIIEKLKTFDVIYYMDCDMIVFNNIYEEILPNQDEIIVCRHMWQRNSTKSYEKYNKNSSAYIDVDSLNFTPEYCQACFFGANTDAFIKMVQELENNINEDFKNNIIAKWHDESHLNKYILNNPKKILDIFYTYPSTETVGENINKIKMIHKNAHSFCEL